MTATRCCPALSRFSTPSPKATRSVAFWWPFWRPCDVSLQLQMPKESPTRYYCFSKLQQRWMNVSI